MELTKLEHSFFDTLDLLGRLKVGASDEARATDAGVKFIDDCFDLLCNIMRGDEKCYFKLCAFYQSVSDDLGGCDITEEALATKKLVDAVFKSEPLK